VGGRAKRRKNILKTELASRKDRRKAAKENGVKFEPQYNGNNPVRGRNKDADKNVFTKKKNKLA
jgi:hypothetical protein